jgi:predicted dehydrogenase
LENGKHAYTEKTFGITLSESQELLLLARSKQLYLGGAPDTFLGAGISTCRKLIEDGWIGSPITAQGSMRRAVKDPAPSWLWQKGAGPLLDMGPYYLTALIATLGSVKEVTSLIQTPFPERLFADADGANGSMQPEVPTHVDALLRFASGVTAQLTTTFDIEGYGRENHLEINGTLGSLLFPDPNTFGGPILFYKRGMPEPLNVPLLYDFAEQSRGLGVADMARAICLGQKARADASLPAHALEVAMRLLEGAESHQFQSVESQCEIPQLPPRNYASELCINGAF